MEREATILDTSVLVNFLVIGRVQLLGSHPRRSFLITRHVRDEVTEAYSQERERLLEATDAGLITETRVEGQEALEAFAALYAQGRLGIGECSAIAAASVRRIPIAIDDTAARKAAMKHDDRLVLLDTQGLMVELIQERRISLEEADEVKALWEREHRFRLRVRSFRDLVE